MADRKPSSHAGTRQHCSVHRTAPAVLQMIRQAHEAIFHQPSRIVTLIGGPGDHRNLWADFEGHWLLLRKH